MSLLAVAHVFTFLGSMPFLAVVGLVIAIGLVWRAHRLLLVAWLAALGGSALLVEVVKVTVHRVRPATAVLALGDSQWSFPSGHAALATVTFGMLTYFVCLRWPTWRVRWLAVGTALLLVAAIGASRIALGMHYPSDVLGGYATGGAWLAICIGGAGTARRTQRRVRAGAADRAGGAEIIARTPREAAR